MITSITPLQSIRYDLHELFQPLRRWYGVSRAERVIDDLIQCQTIPIDLANWGWKVATSRKGDTWSMTASIQAGSTRIEITASAESYIDMLDSFERAAQKRLDKREAQAPLQFVA